MAEAVAIIPKHTGAEVRVTLMDFKGQPVVDLREYADTRIGPITSRAPTAKGCCVPVRRLPDLIEALEAARAAAEREGLLSAP